MRTLLRPAILACGLLLPIAALAAEDVWHPKEDHKAWRTECSACHYLFPPALLSPDDWAVMMSELDKHFGSNAGLDEKTRQEISAYLQRNGNPTRQFGNPDETPRLTGTDWFFRKHKSAYRLLQQGRVKTLIDCAACHQGPDVAK